MKTLRSFFLLLLFSTGRGFAAENRYDLLGHALMPFVNLVAEHSKSPNRSVTLAVRLEQMTDQPPELAGARAEIDLQYPDKLRVHAPFHGEDLTICRNGQDVWVHPGSRAATLIEKLEAQHKLPAPDPDFRLAPFSLPIPEQELVFLPALFEVSDAGAETIDGEKCRVLSVQLNPALARSLGARWSGRLTVHDDGRPARLAVQNPSGWSVAVRFDTVGFQPSLPPAIWQPAPEQAGDVAKLPARRYNQLLRTLFGGS